MNDAKRWVERNIDTKILVSTVAASAIVGLSVIGLRKAGLTTAAKVVKGGA